VNELIKVQDIKNKFNITQQRRWAKIVKNLKTAAIENKRLRRTKSLSIAK